MYFFDRFNSYRLKFREKLGVASHRQALRALKMLCLHPGQSSRQGLLKVNLALTYRCQCACLHCCAGKQSKSGEDELSAGEIEEIIDQISHFPSVATLISFFGGEALLRSEVFRLIAYARKQGLFTEIESNGILLTGETAGNLKKSGLNHIFIRLEGAGPGTHDRLSGYTGSFKLALEAIKNCKKHGLSCSISTVAIKDKIYNHELQEIIKIGESLKVASVRILLPILSGNWINETAQRLSKKEEEAVVKLLKPGFVYLESTDTSTNSSQQVCPSARKKSFYISPYGQLWPCPFVQLDSGNIRSGKLAEMVNKMWDRDFTGLAQAGCLAHAPQIRDRVCPPNL